MTWTQTVTWICDACGGHLDDHDDLPDGWTELADGAHLCADCTSERDRTLP